MVVFRWTLRLNAFTPFFSAVPNDFPFLSFYHFIDILWGRGAGGKGSSRPEGHIDLFTRSQTNLTDYGRDAESYDEAIRIRQIQSKEISFSFRKNLRFLCSRNERETCRCLTIARIFTFPIKERGEEGREISVENRRGDARIDHRRKIPKRFPSTIHV